MCKDVTAVWLIEQKQLETKCCHSGDSCAVEDYVANRAFMFMCMKVARILYGCKNIDTNVAVPLVGC
jgi:hypothetical protein